MKRKLILTALMALLSTPAMAWIANKGVYEGWRSTTIGGPWTNFVVATGPIYIDQLDVSSPSAGSTFRFFSATSNVSGGVLTLSDGTTQQVIITTSSLYDTSTRTSPYSIGVVVPAGFMFTTVGNSTVTVRWDWIERIPRGQENKGKY